MKTIEKNFNYAEAEPRIYEAWEKEGCFRPGDNPNAENYCIVIPPPNVTGSLHMGHALNNTLQDVLCRFERMRGKNVLWQVGTDHAGIATQMVVERQLAERQEKSRRELGREAFLEKVWAWKEESGGTITRQLRRLGASCDWTRERFTMDEGLSEAVRKVFVQLYKEGLIYRDKRLVNWDPKFETAISDLEVENTEVNGHMWHFKYPLAGGETYEYVEKDEDGNVTLREVRDYISIATTRPETMLGDGAVAVHPSDERYAPIVGKLCEIPVGPKAHRRLIPIITDDYPDPDFGSGAVKITGAHDFNDYQVARRNNIPMYRLMDWQAALRDDGAPYAEEAAKARALLEAEGAPDTAYVDTINLVPDNYRGLDRFEARKKIVADIDAEGLMIEIEDKLIMQPFGDRSNVVIEPMLTDQWFANAEELAKPAIEAVESGKTRFVPSNWDKTYFQWMRNIEPWCISRQLWWGHQIPVWYGPDDEMFVAETETEALAAAEAHYGKATDLRQDEDVLDTWFSSALWPFSTLGWPEDTPELDRFYPTTVLSTAFDIIFFWVARMMMMGLHFRKEVPFHTVYIHALVRDEKGQKMSKSKGNVIDPLDFCEKYGTDSLRFTLTAMAAQGRDLKLAESRVEGYRNFGTKLWNAAKFTQMNECRLDETYDPAAVSSALNKWIVHEASACATEMTAAIEAYRFNDAAGAIYSFTWHKFCDWFLEFAKPVFNGEDEAAKAETRATAAYVLDQILIMLHPIMPFITEELWATLATRNDHLINASWPKADVSHPEAGAEMEDLIGLITSIRSVRTEMNVPAGAKVPLVLVGDATAAADMLDAHADLIKRLARIEMISRAEDLPTGAVQIISAGATFALPIADVIDISAEIARLQKSADKLQGEITGIDKKLSNRNFVDKAPAEVVEAQHTQKAAAEEKLRELQTALTRLAELAG
ncbi:MAG: valine--tRNA ligase [Aquisalinus sp.]|nr:valine--tRNA ligase [Aquisalinus sp.]